MNKIRKLIQCLRFRRIILGKVGKKNHFSKWVTTTSAAIIGNNNYFSCRCMIGNAEIGNYCSFGPDVKIGQSKHSIDYITTCQKISSKNVNFSLNQKPAIIESDVWVGANAVIMQGVHVGTGAVVGANAVVTHDIPPYAIVVGVPARIIRLRFDEDTIKTILKTRWWEQDLNLACKIIKDLEKETIEKEVL